MNRKDKKHAKDYLLEYQGKKIQKWLNLLIKQVINTAGAISKNDKDEIFKIFIQENQLNFDQKAELSQLKHKLTSSVGTEKTQKEKNEILILKKITHKRGINALIHDQSLPFNPTCTIIYGLNATGKSGYYRIIHELAGGEQPKTILANIHKPSEDLEVYVDFQLNGKEQPTYVWREKKERGVYPFNQIKVFDSEYLPIFLDERESSSSVEPLGLNLFQVITNVMDEFKYDKLEKLKQKVESQKPDLQPLVELLHSKDLRLILSKTVLAKDNKKLLKDNLSGRYGGDEFILILPYCGIDEVKKITDRLIDKIREIKIKDKPEIRVTTSIGVAVLEKGAACRDSKYLVALADNALYKAKKNGRDQVCVLEYRPGSAN